MILYYVGVTTKVEIVPTQKQLLVVVQMKNVLIPVSVEQVQIKRRVKTCLYIAEMTMESFFHKRNKHDRQGITYALLFRLATMG
jgi:hypothetical protein